MAKAMGVENDHATDFLIKLRTKRDSSCATCGCLPDCCCTTGCDKCNRTDSCGTFCDCVRSRCCQVRCVMLISSFTSNSLHFFPL